MTAPRPAPMFEMAMHTIAQQLRSRTLDAAGDDPAPSHVHLEDYAQILQGELRLQEGPVDLPAGFVCRRGHPLLARGGPVAFDALLAYPIASTPLSEEVARIMALPDVQERMAKLDIKAVGSSSADLAKTISQEIQLWTQVAKDNNIKAE